MTKQELAQKVAADAHIAGAQAKSAVDAAFDAIASRAGRRPRRHDRWVWQVQRQRARGAMGATPPANGETIQIAASTVAKFSAAAALKKQLNS
jgi:nucleoid DNA-binding protein